MLWGGSWKIIANSLHGFSKSRIIEDLPNDLDAETEDDIEPNFIHETP